MSIGVSLDRRHKGTALREYGLQLLDIVTQCGPIQFNPGPSSLNRTGRLEQQ